MTVYSEQQRGGMPFEQMPAEVACEGGMALLYQSGAWYWCTYKEGTWYWHGQRTGSSEAAEDHPLRAPVLWHPVRADDAHTAFWNL